jgi:hypothetical protein
MFISVYIYFGRVGRVQPKCVPSYIGRGGILVKWTASRVLERAMNAVE